PVAQAKPSARVGRKAAGLSETAGLPTGRPVSIPLNCRRRVMQREARTVAARLGNDLGYCGTLLRSAALSLAAILLVTLTFTQAFAARGGKAGIATDLTRTMLQGSPSNTVRLVISLD